MITKEYTRLVVIPLPVRPREVRCDLELLTRSKETPQNFLKHWHEIPSLPLPRWKPARQSASNQVCLRSPGPEGRSQSHSNLEAMLPASSAESIPCSTNDKNNLKREAAAYLSRSSPSSPLRSSGLLSSKWALILIPFICTQICSSRDS